MILADIFPSFPSFTWERTATHSTSEVVRKPTRIAKLFPEGKAFVPKVLPLSSYS